MQQVEHEVGDGRAGAPQLPHSGGELVTLLQQTEVRASLVVQRDDLAVEHGRAVVQQLRQDAQLGEADQEVEVVAAEHPHVTTLAMCDAPVAVPFELDGPAVAVGRVARGGEHGPDDAQRFCRWCRASHLDTSSS